MSYDTDDAIRRAMSDKQNDDHVVVQLSCCGTSVEITERRDQYLTCPTCGKRHVLLWSLNPKLRSETDDDGLIRNFR